MRTKCNDTKDFLNCLDVQFERSVVNGVFIEVIGV